MKKTFFSILLLLILCCFVITGCDFETKKDNSSDLKYLLASKSEVKQLNYTKEFEDFIYKVGDFSTELTDFIYSKFNYKYDQMAISPISIYMALAMATAVSEIEVQKELENVLGLSYEEIYEYTKYLYSVLNNEKNEENLYTKEEELAFSIQLGNSIWLDKSLSYKQSGIDLLKDYFYVDSYMVPFSTENKTANKAIQDFVCRNTKGLINNNFNFDINTLFVLINTLYLKDTWNSLGKELFFTNEEYEFKNKDNSVKSLKLLNGYYFDGKVQSGDGFEYFYTETEHNVKLYFIKPTTKSLDEIYNKDNLSMILKDKDFDKIDHELRQEYYTRCLFPEFTASFSEDIVPVLKEEYGMSKIFRDNVSNFDKVTDHAAVISGIIHQTKLTVDKMGIEGAAVTCDIIGGEAGPLYEQVMLDFVVDKSFGFLVVKNGSVLFSGAVSNL